MGEFSGPGDETAHGVFNGNFQRPYAVKGGPSNPNANGFFSSGNEIVPLAIVLSFLAWVLLCNGSSRVTGKGLAGTGMGTNFCTRHLQNEP